VQNKQLFLRGFHDGADHAVETDICIVLQGDQSNVVVLPLEPAVLYGNESVGEEYVGLQFLTAQADKQRAPTEVGVAGNITQGADGDDGIRRLNGDTAAIHMFQRYDVIYVGIFGQQFFAYAFDCVGVHDRDALNGSGYGQQIACAEGPNLIAQV